MQKIITPTVGRVVWYWPGEADLKQPASGGLFMRAMDNSQPMAATVACVLADRLVNLVVTDHVGAQHPRIAVRLVQPGDEFPSDNIAPFCLWMPYQVGQAAAALK